MDARQNAEVEGADVGEGNNGVLEVGVLGVIKEK